LIKFKTCDFNTQAECFNVSLDKTYHNTHILQYRLLGKQILFDNYTLMYQIKENSIIILIFDNIYKLFTFYCYYYKYYNTSLIY